MKQYKLNVPLVRLQLLVASLLLLGATPTSGQQQAHAREPHATAQANFNAQPPYRLRLLAATSLPLITLRARKASLAEVAAELERQLKTKVNVSSLMLRHQLTLNFRDLKLETSLRLLAPQVYIDYEISGDAKAQRKLLAIYLYALNEAAPSIFGTINNSSETLLIEGDTDEVIKAPNSIAAVEGETSLHVSFEKNLLSVRAQKQPLAVVLYMVANKVGIPFALRSESRELISANFNGLTLEEAIHKLSPNVRLYIRADLQRSRTQPLRLVFESNHN